MVVNEKNASGTVQFDDKGGTKGLEWDGSSRLAGVRGQSIVVQTGKVVVNKQKEKLWTTLKNRL